MTASDTWFNSARAALQRPRGLAEAEGSVPGTPGLYAIHGDASVWRDLGLGEAPDGRPLYIGKAEKSLIVRDVETHFGDGRTGSSTVRRSFAALLRGSLGLRGLPRNLVNPERPENYGLSPEDDAKLTRWMRERLALATWSKPSACTVPLADLERALIDELQPPLTLNRGTTHWSTRIKDARAMMAGEARAWMAGRR